MGIYRDRIRSISSTSSARTMSAKHPPTDSTSPPFFHPSAPKGFWGSKTTNDHLAQGLIEAGFTVDEAQPLWPQLRQALQWLWSETYLTMGSFQMFQGTGLVLDGVPNFFLMDLIKFEPQDQEKEIRDRVTGLKIDYRQRTNILLMTLGQQLKLFDGSMRSTYGNDYLSEIDRSADDPTTSAFLEFFQKVRSASPSTIADYLADIREPGITVWSPSIKTRKYQDNDHGVPLFVAITSKIEAALVDAAARSRKENANALQAIDTSRRATVKYDLRDAGGLMLWFGGARLELSGREATLMAALLSSQDHTVTYEALERDGKTGPTSGKGKSRNPSHNKHSRTASSLRATLRKTFNLDKSQGHDWLVTVPNKGFKLSSHFIWVQRGDRRDSKTQNFRRELALREEERAKAKRTTQKVVPSPARYDY